MSIPQHILISSHAFPSANQASSAPTLSSPSSVSYHFASDPPVSPLAHLADDPARRVLIWDIETGQTTSLSGDFVAKGARKDGEGVDEVWVVEVQDGPASVGAEEDEG
jgi:hypothetical protein